MGYLKEAAIDYEKSALIAPELEIDNLFFAGEAYFTVGAFDKAESLFQRVVEKSKSDKHQQMAKGFLLRIQNLKSM